METLIGVALLIFLLALVNACLLFIALNRMSQRFYFYSTPE